MTNTCATTEPLLQAYLDGELDIEESHQVEGHIGECAGCREARGELQALGERLRGLHKAREEEPVEVQLPGAAEVSPAKDGAVQAAVSKWVKKKTPASPTPTVSTQFGGYRVEAEIARGGMGVVYRAVQVSMDRRVALKVLAANLSENEKYVARFLREAKLAATISHPNLVAIYDVGQDGNRLYYSMEFVEGEDVEAVLKREGTIPQRRAAEIGLEVAKALEAAAERSVVHRDVKPANVLLTPEGSVKLADLGLAKDVDDQDASLTRSKTVIGSPNYMSPEQAEDLRKAEPRSDVYMLGATLLHMISGEVPFGSGSPIEILARVLRDAPALPDVVGGEAFDPALRAIVAKCLEKAPADRFASAGELRETLEAYLAGAVSGVSPKSRRVRRSARARRTPSSEGKVAGMRRSGSSEGRVRTSGTGGLPPALLVAVAALLLGAVALALFGGSSGEADEPLKVVATPEPAPPPRKQQLVSDAQPKESAKKDSAPPTAREEVPSDVVKDGGAQPPAPEVRDEAADPEADVRLAKLEQFRRENPDQLGELYRRSREIADQHTGSESGARAKRMEEETAARLRELFAEAEERAMALEEEGRLWEAQRQFASFVSDFGEEAPGASQAQLAARALKNQIQANLGQDMDTLQGLYAEGKTKEAEALLAKVGAYAGQDIAARAREQHGDAMLAKKLAKKEPQEEPQEEGKLSLGGHEKKKEDAGLQEALAMLDRARGALEEGKLGRVENLLKRARERAGDGAPAEFSNRARELSDALAAKLAGQKGPELGVMLAAFFRGEVEVLEGERVRISYAFKKPEQAEDWKVHGKAGDRGQQMLREWLDGQGTPQKVAPWTVQRGYLVGYGYDRAQFLATFDGSQAIDVELDARGQQNLMVGFGANDGTTLAGLGFVYEPVQIAQLMAWNKRTGGGLKDYFERMERTISQSRQRGPSLAVFREGNLFHHKDGEKMLPLRLKKRTKFSVSLRPSAEDEGYREVEIQAGKKLREVTSVQGKAGGPVVLGLAALGAPMVAYKEIVISGKLHPRFLEQLRNLAKGLDDVEGLRRAYDEAEEKKRKEDQARRQGGGGRN